MQRARLLSIAVLAILAVIVVLQNTATVETRILFFRIEAPRAVLLAVTLLIGFVLGLLAAWRHGAARRSG